MAIKSFTSTATEVEILTDGLDELKIINSENETIEVSLFDENPNSHHILINDETSVLKIAFDLKFIQKNAVFRKFITNRLNRASAIIKLPKNKTLTILGTNIDIVAKNYNGNLNIYIDKGYINLNKIQQNTNIKLFQGNVFAETSSSNITIKSNKGKILVNDEYYPKKYEKETLNTSKAFKVSSINANINLTVFK